MRASARPVAYRAILANRTFVALWLGQATSQFGDALYDLALLWYVLDATGSGFAAAAIAIASGGGRFVGSLIGGVVLDRLATRRVMLATEAIRCALTAGLGVAWLGGLAPSLPLLYALAAALSCCGALFIPARLAAIPQLVERESLVAANALDQIAASLVSTVAWGASGAIVVLIGPARGLLLDAASFFVSLVAIAAARWSADAAAGGDAARPERFRTALLGGVRWLRGSRPGRAVLLAQLVQAFAGGAFFAGIGPHLQRNLDGDAATYGIQGTVYGVALMLGAWAIGRGGVRRIGLLYAAGFLINGLGNGGFALAPSLAALLPAAFLAGIGAAAFITAEITLLQTVVPAAVRGRVVALTILLATATGMVGLACGGWLADHWHLRLLMFLASVVHIAVGLALWAYPALRHAHTGAVPDACTGPA